MQVFSSEIFENFKNTYFEEHLRTAAPERLRKPNPLLVSGKPLLGGKRHNWATNMNLMKLVSAIFTLYQNAFWYFFQASEESKSDNDNDFKIS